MVEETQNSVQGQARKKRHGCFFWGCLIVTIIGVFVMGIVGTCVWKIRQKALSFTSTTPAEVSVIESSQDEYEEIKERVSEFLKAVEEDRNAELSLTAQEINTLIAKSPELAEFTGRVYVRIEGDEISVDTALPLDKVPSLGGRYLNGTIGLKVSLQGGILVISPETVVVGGQPLPENIMNELRRINLAEKLYEDKEKIELIKKFKRIEVTDGKIVIVM